MNDKEWYGVFKGYNRPSARGKVNRLYTNRAYRERKGKAKIEEMINPEVVGLMRELKKLSFHLLERASYHANKLEGK